MKRKIISVIGFMLLLIVLALSTGCGGDSSSNDGTR
jgi:hypothetical protein